VYDLGLGIDIFEVYKPIEKYFEKNFILKLLIFPRNNIVLLKLLCVVFTQIKSISKNV